MITVMLGIALTTQVKKTSEEDSDESEIGGDVDWDCTAMKDDDSGDSVEMMTTPV